jgi:predicted transcriptional regulator
MSTLTLRISEERKRALQREAEKRHETLTEFILKCTLYRVTQGKQEDWAKDDPFLEALAEASPLQLSKAQFKAVADARQRPERSIPLSQAIAEQAAHSKKH